MAGTTMERAWHMSEEIDVETFVAGLPAKHLACRRLGHPWRSHTVHQDGSGFTEVLRCPSCGTKRLDTLNRHGHVIGRRYDYADGYQATNVTGGVAGQRDLFRLEALTRLVASTEEQAAKRAAAKRAPAKRTRKLSAVS
jgi:hypothetical protein